MPIPLNSKPLLLYKLSKKEIKAFKSRWESSHSIEMQSGQAFPVLTAFKDLIKRKAKKEISLKTK